MTSKIFITSISICMSLAVTTRIHAAPINATYTAEGLTVGSSIISPQQDNWIVYSGTGDAIAQTVTHPENGSTTVLKQSSGIQMSRISDGNFSFNPHTASNTAATLIFDAHYVAASDLVFGLGDDLGVNTNNRLGPVFGFSGNNYFLRQAVFGSNVNVARPAGDDLGDWYQLKLVIDFTAFGGAGSGDMFVRNMTDGELAFRPTPIFNDFNLGITSMSGISQDPATWNTLYVRLGLGNEADNLNPNFTVVPPPLAPEPSAVWLVACGGLGMLRFTRRNQN